VSGAETGTASITTCCDGEAAAERAVADRRRPAAKRALCCSPRLLATRSSRSCWLSSVSDAITVVRDAALVRLSNSLGSARLRTRQYDAFLTPKGRRCWDADEQTRATVRTVYDSAYSTVCSSARLGY